jgi:Mrp family chromosome partitioning ATPase
LTTALEQHDGDWISDNLVSTDIEHLRLMPSGPLPHNPAELLESPRMRELHDTLLQYADVVIFDTSPLMRVVDAALVAHFTDTALAVVRANTTRAEALLQFRHRLEGFHVNLLGVVLNEAREELSGSYGYGYGSKPGGLLDDKADREQGTSVKMVEVPRNGKATPQDVAHIANSGGGSSFGATDSGKSHTG